MATEVNQDFFAWSQEETFVKDISQGTSQVFGHGSISFGRFDLESLEWEKWSVFTNDRRHEEFGNFNGLVAKKKAYFEEYFKRIRELKALEQQNQQTELHLEYNGDGSNSSQTGEYEPAADHGARTESGTLVDDSTEHDYHENGSLANEISASTHSSPVGGLQQFGKQMRDVSGKMDMLKQDPNSSHGDPGMAHEIMITPNRIIEKDSRISQASKIIPKTIKMTSNNASDHTVLTKGPGSGKPSVLNPKPENIQSLRRPRETASSMVGATTRSGTTGLGRVSSAASQWPSTRERRPITRDASRRPSEVTTLCRPSTSERRPATRESKLKHASNATARRRSISDRCPMTKESELRQCNVATPCRPSTVDKLSVTKESTRKLSKIATPNRPASADRRPITKGSAPNLFSVASPHRPSTSERRTSTRDMATKHVGTATSCQPSAVKKRPITREGAPKHADVVPTMRHPSTSERSSIVRDVAPRNGTVAPSCRPSTAERRPISRDVALKHCPQHRPSTAERRPITRDQKHALPHRPSTAERRPAPRETTLHKTNVATSLWPLTPDRCLTQRSAISTPQRPSTGERRPITNSSTMKPDPKAPIGSRAMLNYSRGAMVREGTPEKAITPSTVISSKLENISYVKGRVEFQVDSKQKSSPFNLPSRKMLTSNVRDDRGLENFRKPSKEGLREGVCAQAYKSNNMTPPTRAPAPPPPPPPPGRPSCTARKPKGNNSPAGGRKPKASTPHWH